MMGTRFSAWAAVAILLASACATGSRSTPPLPGSGGSPEEVARALLDALATGTREPVAALAVTREEFERVIWPALPAAHPDSGLTPEFVWGMYAPKNASALRSLVARHGGRRYRLVAVELSGPARDYGSYSIHPETRLRVRDASGAEHRLRLFGSLLEKDGRFKIYGFVTD